MIQILYKMWLIGVFITVVFLTGCANLNIHTYSMVGKEEPVRGVAVSVSAQSQTQDPVRRVTNSKGNTGFTLKPGLYTIQCQKRGFFDAERPINFDGNESRYTIPLVPECTLSGNLTLFDGSIPGKVVVRAISSENIKQGETWSAEDGSFKLKPIKPGSYLITAETIDNTFYGELNCDVNSLLVNIEIEMERKEYDPSNPHIDPTISGPDQIKPPSIH